MVSEQSQQAQDQVSESCVKTRDNMNVKIRRFQDSLVDLVNSYEDIPIEARLVVLELITSNVQRLADNTIIEELSKEAANAEGIPENQLAELSK